MWRCRLLCLDKPARSPCNLVPSKTLYSLAVPCKSVVQSSKVGVPRHEEQSNPKQGGGDRDHKLKVSCVLPAVAGTFCAICTKTPFTLVTPLDSALICVTLACIQQSQLLECVCRIIGGSHIASKNRLNKGLRDRNWPRKTRHRCLSTFRPAKVNCGSVSCASHTFSSPIHPINPF